MRTLDEDLTDNTPTKRCRSCTMRTSVVRTTPSALNVETRLMVAMARTGRLERLAKISPNEGGRTTSAP